MHLSIHLSIDHPSIHLSTESLHSSIYRSIQSSLVWLRWLGENHRTVIKSSLTRMRTRNMNCFDFDFTVPPPTHVTNLLLEKLWIANVNRFTVTSITCHSRFCVLQTSHYFDAWCSWCIFFWDYERHQCHCKECAPTHKYDQICHTDPYWFFTYKSLQ